MKHECPMVCDCTYSSGCRIEQVASVTAPAAEDPTPEPRLRKTPRYPGIRHLALQQTAQRREARTRRREAAPN